jgi:hypothetical protein
MKRAGVLLPGDRVKLDDESWHGFTLSRHDRNTGKWDMDADPSRHRGNR